ncbi:ZIP family metal transporter [Tepidibacter formicigenes]|jgi:ZIP family zinc transporter|uniref:Zinc transporter, ZIP family n=1 Tax=Tepidibacter formicigenes DSM 15518 TaxID=1123349 RepID=A0A1M6MQ46_9FIRM|nr:ZIP family metal transporter [Tepidibacter formicigenes]SHJ85587.1 zinc transporter, ZIP family [Tepidibacter formicigenes DSM 15518]
MLKIALIGFLSGIVGTFLGGVISFVFRNKADKYLGFFMGIAGGIMLSVVTFDLLSEAMEQIGVNLTVLYTFLGVLISVMLKKIIHFDGMLKTGYLIFLSILLHNFPEGLAIGSSFLLRESLGFTLAIVIGIHNVPEGIAMALSLIKGKMKISKVMLFTILAGVPMGVGSYFGAYFAESFSSVIGIFLAIAGGTMLYVTLEEIFPNSKTIYSIIGFLLGIVIVKVF